MRPYSSAQPFLRDSSVRRRIKAYSTFASLDRGCECGGFKKEIGKPGKADRLFRLMDINGVCHIVFCGRLEARFLGVDGSFYCLPLFCACKALKIKDFSAPNCPHKTSFSVHFLFSAACELWRHSRDSISPGWTLGRTLCRRPHSVLAPYPGKSPLPASRSSGKTDQRNHLQQTEKEMVWGQVWVSPSSRSIQFPSS